LSGSSHYDDVLEELRQKGQKLANQYIVELYNILRDEEKLPPEDCREQIEHDCLDLWSRATIRKYLPPEAKDAKKQKAGRAGGEKKKELQLLAAQNGARTNLAENTSISQSEEESRSFHNQLNEQLSGRKISPELLEANKIIADRDKEIEELKQLLLKEEHLPKSNNNALLFLPNKLAMEIFDDITGVISSSGDATSVIGFNLEHDGQQVTTIYAVKMDTLPSSQATNNPSQASHQSQLIEQQTTLKAEESTDNTSTTPAATALEENIVAITGTIHRIHPHSDVFRCDNCIQRGDKWYMQKHFCKGRQTERRSE
jgi:hypothetical protein